MKYKIQKSKMILPANSSVASPICQEGQSERTFPIFPIFPDFFPLFPDFLPLFSNFWQFFRCQEGHSAPNPPSGHATACKPPFWCVASQFFKVCFVSWCGKGGTAWEWTILIQRFSRAGPRGRGIEWATLGVQPLSWLLSNNRLEEVCGTLTKGTFSSRLLLSNQDKGYTPSVTHSLPLPPGFC